MGRSTAGLDNHAQGAFGGNRLVAFGRLAIDQVAVSIAELVGCTSSVTSILLANEVEHAKVANPFLSQPVCCGNLGRDYSLRVTRATAVDALFVFTRRNERRDGVEM